MKRICPGTLITLVFQSRKRSTDKPKTICKGIFAAYDCDINGYSKYLSGHLKSGHDPVPGPVIDAARNMDANDVVAGFEQYVCPLIDENMAYPLVRAIKAVLREDTTIGDSFVVGYVPGYEKENILRYTEFDKAALLANLFTYAIRSTENDKFENAVSEISDDFVDSFKNSTEPIHFIHPSVDQDQFSPLKRTLKDPMFDHIFKKAADITIARLANPTTASVYYIEPTNCKFKFRDLEEFIVDNIGGYVFSRAKVRRILDRTKKRSAVGSQAMLKFIKTYGAEAGNVLGEILLYVFLEQVLDAPKIMSKIEINESRNNSVSKSDGIHLLSQDISGQPFHQLVFGASDMVGKLTDAVDRAFVRIKEIEDNADDEFLMVDNTTQWTIYDPDATQYMYDLMHPRRPGMSKPDMAFGVFLGYTIPPIAETNSAKYRVAVRKQLISDIKEVQQYIAQKIIDENLSGYSFYFYVMPFNNAPGEKTSIIEDLLSGGDF